jgi:hypothetical protein
LRGQYERAERRHAGSATGQTRIGVGTGQLPPTAVRVLSLGQEANDLPDPRLGQVRADAGETLQHAGGIEKLALRPPAISATRWLSIPAPISFGVFPAIDGELIQIAQAQPGMTTAGGIEIDGTAARDALERGREAQGRACFTFARSDTWRAPDALALAGHGVSASTSWTSWVVATSCCLMYSGRTRIDG